MKNVIRFSFGILGFAVGIMLAYGINDKDWAVIILSLTIFICGLILTIYKTT